jgi:uncharacterized membrane protein YidH (DUF202 family)
MSRETKASLGEEANWQARLEYANTLTWCSVYLGIAGGGILLGNLWPFEVNGRWHNWALAVVMGMAMLLVLGAIVTAGVGYWQIWRIERAARKRGAWPLETGIRI